MVVAQEVTTPEAIGGEVEDTTPDAEPTTPPAAEETVPAADPAPEADGTTLADD